jgi:hypothetical protein
MKNARGQLRHRYLFLRVHELLLEQSFVADILDDEQRKIVLARRRAPLTSSVCNSVPLTELDGGDPYGSAGSCGAITRQPHFDHSRRITKIAKQSADIRLGHYRCDRGAAQTLGRNMKKDRRRSVRDDDTKFTVEHDDPVRQRTA